MILAGWAGVFAFKILSGWASFEYTNFFLFLLGDGGRNCETRTISCNFFILFLEISYLIFVQDLMTWSTWKTKTLFNFFFWLTVYIETGLVYLLLLLLLLLMLLLLLDTCKTCKLANFSGDKTFWRQNLKKFSAEFRPKASLQLRFKLKVIV